MSQPLSAAKFSAAGARPTLVSSKISITIRSRRHRAAGRFRAVLSCRGVSLCAVCWSSTAARCSSTSRCDSMHRKRSSPTYSEKRCRAGIDSSLVAPSKISSRSNPRTLRLPVHESTYCKCLNKPKFHLARHVTSYMSCPNVT